MTTARYTGDTYREIEVLQDGRVIAAMDVAKFCAIDCELADTAARAMQSPGTQLAIPSYGRVPAPRNKRVHGICQ
jgi:hypothetical protein